MKFRVSQQFETLGDACTELVHTREAAESVAAALRDDIAEMVARWQTPNADSEGRPTGCLPEFEVWARAAQLADGAPTYGREAGEYIAEQAVGIDDVE